jgi:hypothetical protein
MRQSCVLVIIIDLGPPLYHHLLDWSWYNRVKVVPVLNWVSTAPWRCMGSGFTDARFLDLGTSWRWVVSFTPQLLTSRERGYCTHWIEGWVGHGAALDDMQKWKFFTLPRFQLPPLGHVARSQSLYCLRYCGSVGIIKGILAAREKVKRSFLRKILRE